MHYFQKAQVCTEVKNNNKNVEHKTSYLNANVLKNNLFGEKSVHIAFLKAFTEAEFLSVFVRLFHSLEA